MSYLLILTTILATVYGQLIIKWQVIQAGAIPAGISEKGWFFLKLLFNPWVLTVYVAVLIAGVSWMAAMTKLELSFAYPFMSATFVLVMLLSPYFFNESLNPYKIIGMGLIVVGLIIGSQG